MNVVSAFSVKPGIFGKAPSPWLKTMNRELTPFLLSASAYSLGSVSVYCVDPSRFLILIILCSTILGMLIVFILVVCWDNIGR